MFAARDPSINNENSSHHDLGPRAEAKELLGSDRGNRRLDPKKNDR
jgi:hypothetical protein